MPLKNKARRAEYRRRARAESGFPVGELPRNRLIDLGPESLSSIELLAILIEDRHGRRRALEAATEMLSEQGGLRRLAALSSGELERFPGIGATTACRVKAAFELGKRCACERLRRGAPVLSSRDIFEAFSLRLRDLKKETFWTVLLDGQHRVITELEVSTGTLTTSVVHPREVFSPAVRLSAAAVILLHNHPSGDPRPSRMDWEVSRRLLGAGELLGIRVLDHVIIGDNRFVSLKEESALFD